MRPWLPRVPLGRSRRVGLDIVGHILFERFPTQPARTSRPSQRSSFPRRDILVGENRSGCVIGPGGTDVVAATDVVSLTPEEAEEADHGRRIENYRVHRSAVGLHRAHPGSRSGFSERRERAFSSPYTDVGDTLSALPSPSTAKDKSLARRGALAGRTDTTKLVPYRLRQAVADRRELTHRTMRSTSQARCGGRSDCCPSPARGEAAPSGPIPFGPWTRAWGCRSQLWFWRASLRECRSPCRSGRIGGRPKQTSE